MANLPEENGSAGPTSPPPSSRNLSPARSQPSRPTTPFPDLLDNVGDLFKDVPEDRPEADPGVQPPKRVVDRMPPDNIRDTSESSPPTPAQETGSETASNRTTRPGASTASPKTSSASTSEAEAGPDDPTPAPDETLSRPSSTFDLPVRTGSNPQPAEDNSAPSQTDNENKRKASASETDTTPQKKATHSNSWLD